MRNVAGSPGTKTSLCLRLLQSGLAILSIKFVIFTNTVDLNSKTYSYFMLSMLAQLLWSFSLALLDAYALIKDQRLDNRFTVGFMAAGDWATGLMSLAAASVMAAIVAVYNSRETGCQFKHPCELYQLSATFSFFCWVATAVSSLIMFYVASGSN